MTTFITVEEVKQQSYLNAGDDEDVYLQMLIDAAIEFIEDYTNRTLIEKGAKTDDDFPLVFGTQVKIAALLLIAHWYENRETSNTSNPKEIPFGFTDIMWRRKRIPI